VVVEDHERFTSVSLRRKDPTASRITSAQLSSIRQRIAVVVEAA
jgi:hypothetical protein